MQHRIILSMDAPTYYIECPKLSALDIDEICVWLDNTPGGTYTFGGTGVYFYREVDATLFALRWS